MKKKTRHIVVLPLLIFYFSSCMVKAEAAGLFCNAETFQQKQPPQKIIADSVLKVKQLPYIPKLPGPKPKQTNFVQKFLAAFSYKKNTDANERVRVKAFFDSMRLDTNLAISIKNIQLLKGMVDTANRYLIDSVLYGMQYIDSLKKQEGAIRLQSDSIKQQWRQLQSRYDSDIAWINNPATRSVAAQYNITAELNKLRVSVPGDSDHADSLVKQLKSFALADSIRIALIANNIFFYPRPAMSKTDSVYIGGRGEMTDEEQKKEAWWYLFGYVIHHPCAACVVEPIDSATRKASLTYMKQLGIDSVIKSENLDRIYHGKTPFFSRFEYINHVLTGRLKVITLVILSVLIGLLLIYYLLTVNRGDRWKGKRLAGYVNIFTAYLLVISFVSYLYSADTFPYVGVKANINTVYLLDKVPLPDSTYSFKRINPAVYVTLPDVKCSDISLPEVLLYTSIVFLIAYLLIIPSVIRRIQRKQIP